MMKAAIIAGGKGSRLKDTYSVPKPLVLINNKPIIEYQFELLSQFGIRDVVLLLGYGAQEIMDFCGDGSKWGLNFTFSVEEEPLGTAGALLHAKNHFNDDFLVLYADVAMQMDLHRFIRFHRTNHSKATLAVHPNDHPFDSDLIDCDNENRITAFFPKPHTAGVYYRNLVNAAVYILNPSVFEFIPTDRPSDFGKDVFPNMVGNVPMFAYNTIEYIKDMGTPQRVKEVEEVMASGRWERASYKTPQKAIFFDRDGVLNLDPGFVKNPEEMMLYPFTAKAVKLANKSDYASIVITNQSGIARNLYTEEGLRQIHNKMEWLLGEEGAKLDAIYYCPHHPDKGFPEENPALKIDCDCRKPKPGMILKAAREFCINLPESWMIGDSGRDMMAAKAAGVTPVAVRTGNGMEESVEKPDFFFDNVYDAVDFIVNDPCHNLFIFLYEKYNLENHDTPFIIVVGGNSGAGKSTVAASIKQKFSKMGLSTCLVHLDYWIKPAHLRGENENVFDRFRLDEMEEDLQSFLDGEIISIPKYDRFSRSHKGHVSLGMGKSQVVIIEGVPALACTPIMNVAKVKIYCDMDEELYRERFYARYIWKGLPEEEIEKLFEERKQDERRHIDQTKSVANIVFKLNTSEIYE